MAKKRTKKSTEVLRERAENRYAAELKALAKTDQGQRPQNWKLSPRVVVTYLLGGTLEDGTEISPKYYGKRRLVEVAVATLATDRALLLVGLPGTAKTWVSEHLAAAISGNSELLVQGTAGLHEEALRYGWNYARLLSEGPSREALVPSPVVRAMETGQLVRIEELTRIPSDVQDALITVLSEKIMPIPELNISISAKAGFNLIATANDRDKGVNELSSALRRRFNTLIMPLPTSLEEEVNIVQVRASQLGQQLQLPVPLNAIKEVSRLVTIFRELRSGKTEDGRTRLKQPSSTLSPAEAISVVNNGLSLATHFGNGTLTANDIADGLKGAIVKDPSRDLPIWEEYLETVVRDRKGWSDLYEVCKAAL